MISSGSDSEADVPAQPLKPVRKPETWKQHVSKRKRDSGEAYISRTTGQQVAARRVGPPCKCSNKCFEKVGHDNVQFLFDSFYALNNHYLQSHYIHSRVKVVKVKRTRVKHKGTSRRQASREYTVLVNNELISVCKQAFLSIHNISDKRMRNVLIKAKASGNGTLPNDQRGRHEPSNKTSDEAHMCVRDFFSLLTCKSHYPRVTKSPNKMYLTPGSTFAGVYNTYLQHLKKNNKEQLKVSTYVFSQIMSVYNVASARKPVPGRPLRSFKADLLLQRKVMKDPSLTASALKINHPKELQNVSERTIQHRLQKQLNLPTRAPADKPMGEKRLAFARKHQHWTAVSTE